MCLLPTACSAGRTATATGDHAGLNLRLDVSVSGGALVARTIVKNTRAEPISLDADQCGRVADVVLARTAFEPEGEPQTGSVAGLKELVLRGQRSRQDPELFAPRRVGGGSDVPDCTRPDRPISLAPGASIEERRELRVDSSAGLKAVGSARTQVRAEAVEAVAPDRISFLDILPTGMTEATRAGRNVIAETPTSSVLDLGPTDPDVGPSLGQIFDRMVEDDALRAFIDAQPPGSWKDASLGLDGRSPGLRFTAVTSEYERPATATVANDGREVRDLQVPGASDRARVFERRPGTLPPGITLIPQTDGAHISDDVVAGPLVLPSGQAVADGFLAGGSEALPFPADAGSFPTFVTLVRYEGSSVESVALATVVISDAPTTAWKRGYAIAVDGGTAGFTSLEGSEALGRLAAREADWTAFQEAAFDSLTAHDGLVTEYQIGDGLNLAMFSTGLGDGQYPVRVGLDTAGRPTRYVLDCLLLHLAWPEG